MFGYPGDGINGIMGAFNRNDRGCQFIQVRHEEMAAFMACGFAKMTGKVGVCLATSGPGAIHLLNGLYDAKMDHTPVVAIVGQAATTAMGGYYQQEVDLHTLFKDVAAEYVHTAMSPEQIRYLVDRAFRTAPASALRHVHHRPQGRPGNVRGRGAAPRARHRPLGVGYNPPRVLPPDGDLQRAAEMLNAGEKVAMLVGAGATRARRDAVLVRPSYSGPASRRRCSARRSFRTTAVRHGAHRPARLAGRAGK